MESRLLTHYNQALSLKDQDPVTLKKVFDLSLHGASCLHYMLRVGEYCPELEDIYGRDDDIKETENDEPIHWIEFLEDLHPYKRLGIYDEIPEKDKEIYVSMGVARYMTNEERRQLQIDLYVKIARILHQDKVNTLEALAHNDVEFFRDSYNGNDESETIKLLRKQKYSEKQIAAILEMIRKCK